MLIELVFLAGIIRIDPASVPEGMQCAEPTGWQECRSTTTSSTSTSSISSTSTSSTSSSTALTPSTTSTTIVTGAKTFYLSPDGSDSAAGNTIGTAWKTFGKVLNANRPVQPGDSIVLLDGNYTRQTTGLPSIRCGENANDGTQAKPITIRAMNERKAHLRSDGQQAGFHMEDCDWWRVRGLYARNQDNTGGSQSNGFPFRFSRVQNIDLYRLLGSHNNRMQNTHIFAIENSQRVLIEECEAYFFHRHAFSTWKSRFITYRRVYAHDNFYGKDGCCSTIDNRDYGDEAISFYGTSDSIIENSISDHASGFHIPGIANPLDPAGNGGRNNRNFGSISIDDSVPTLAASRVTDGVFRDAGNNWWKDLLVIGGLGHGSYMRGVSNAMLENVTIVNGPSNSGIVADKGDAGLGGPSCDGNPNGCSIFVTNALLLNNGMNGFLQSAQKTWRVEYTNSFGNAAGNYVPTENLGDDAGNIRRSMSVAATLPATCRIRPPANMRGIGKDGKDIGANVVMRYQDGQLSSMPLWPFPCGAIVPGVNDGERRCTNVHTRIGIACGG